MIGISLIGIGVVGIGRGVVGIDIGRGDFGRGIGKILYRSWISSTGVKCEIPQCIDFKLYLPFCAPPVPIAAVAVGGLAGEAKPVFCILKPLQLLLQLTLLQYLPQST